jgi:hypothetical protein
MIKRNRWIVFFCFGLMALSAGFLPAAAGSERQQWADLKARLEAQGWTQIGEKVFERQRGPHKVEHLGYGREGLAWTIKELGRQREMLLQEYEAYPSEDLAKVIDNLGVKIAKASRELRGMPKEGLSSMTEAVTGASCSSICYSATADAFPLSSTQGVSAVADATFNSSCGFVGETYAFAHARATLNGTTTTITQEEPDSGASASSHAVATVNGGSITGTPCFSTANSYAQSTALGIAYSTSDTNDGVCPLPPTPLSVTISGTTSEFFLTASCRTRTWTSTVSGGIAPYTYQWKFNGTAVGTGSSYTRSVCSSTGDFTLQLTVTDVNGATASDTHFVNVAFEPLDPCDPVCL